MHDLIDTEEFDAATERYWPDSYKGVIREKLATAVTCALLAGSAFESVYRKHYEALFSTYEELVERIAAMVVVGAENGSDIMFLELHAALVADAPLPLKRRYSRLLLPGVFGESLQREVKQTLVEEYGKEHAFEHAAEHYGHAYEGFQDFLGEVADLVVTGAVNGADDMLRDIYRSLYLCLSLPPSRRRPIRLKRW